MGLLRMLSRSAIICNGCFLLVLLALHFRQPLSAGLFSLLVITGLFLSVLLNAIVLGWWLMLKLGRKGSTAAFSPVLIGIDALFLLFQIIMLYK